MQIQLLMEKRGTTEEVKTNIGCRLVMLDRIKISPILHSLYKQKIILARVLEIKKLIALKIYMYNSFNHYIYLYRHFSKIQQI